ncbi:DNA-binding response regulator, OmpR family, contains REC and winged-helix (wHTH) domain [Evansella caseinilytica]|uniref:DNA-binding response regulator, OmpR family, contains REC and winged-helix (WHTH) domain n=1 Tax=Evansella caseinilytica TaxID=1503961 RepID=A0A1H3UQ12_9BACI|nr:response regulator transcription factor [Evansella caseinilytica]SDZ64488.1 DNA-binding response regulator, OmpR family, contains REC and winged-helix (wHTH) domain [Evansella caseinilytica]
MVKILYIEDELELGAWVKEDFAKRGYEVTWLTNGEQVMDHLDNADIIILDIMLPGLDGFSLGRRIKKEYPAIPIMMLSARSAVDDKLEGLQFAEDYVTKPFHPEELAARVHVLLRRFDRDDSAEMDIRHLRYYPKLLRLIDRETEAEITLTSKQLQIFEYLLKHAGQIITKEQIYESVWGETYLEGDKTLMVHIRYLREKIERDPAKPAIIETIRGIGYRLMR